MERIELLAPAKDLETGQAAINCGADAVYIGATKFGAREAAGNSLDDIRALVAYTHKYWARVYVTLNTLLYDEELPAAERLARDLYEAGADALIIQDAGLLELDLPPLPLFASTQMHNHTPERVAFLEKVGIQRDLGVGYEAMIPRDLAWVLSRVKVRFYHFPGMDERVTVQTWPKGLAQKVFFMRDHRLTTPDGRLVAEGSSAYILVNPRLRRIAMPSSLDLPVPDNNGLAAIDETLDKIPPAEPVSECLTVRAGYSAVDIMEHVNNARYIEWIADCFSMEEHRAARPAWLQVNYINEIKPGETVTLYRGQRPGDPDSWYITGVNRTTEARAFEAELHWTRA